MTELELILQILTIAGVIAGVTWKLATVKDELENALDKKIDPLHKQIGEIKTTLIEMRSQVALLEARHNSDITRVNDRVGNLHNASKSKLSDFGYTLNSLIDFLEKNEICGVRYLRRSRDKDTINGDDSWTEFRKND